MTADDFHKWIMFRPHSATIRRMEKKTYYHYHNGFCFVAIVGREKRKYIMMDDNNIAILIYSRKFIGKGEVFHNEWIKEPSDIDLAKLRLAL